MENETGCGCLAGGIWPHHALIIAVTHDLLQIILKYTVKAEIFGGVLFSVTSVPTIFTENKTHRKFRYYRYCIHLVLEHLPGKRVYRKFPSTEPPILEYTENITPPKISAL